MIYLTQLIYIQPGQEAVFDEFESRAIPLIPQYNGQLLLRIRPTGETVIHSTVEQPYEIHLVSFPGDEDFYRFLQDEERKQFLHLKEESIRTTLLVKGQKV